MPRKIFLTTMALLFLCLVMGVRTAKADSFTESFEGYTFGSAGKTGVLFGHLTLNSDYLPSLKVPGPNPFPNPYSSWALTWKTNDGTVVIFDTLSVQIGPYSYYGYDPMGRPGCSLISGQVSSGGQAYVPCSQSLSFGYNGDPLFLSMEVQGGFFDQGGLWINYDNTEGPGYQYGADTLRGTWTLVPEPAGWMLVLVGVSVLFFLKLKS